MTELIDHIITSYKFATPETEQQLVLKKTRLLARRRIAWLRKIWTEMAQTGNGEFTPHVEVDGYLLQIDDPIREKDWIENDPGMQELTDAIEATDKAIDAFKGSRLLLLSQLFGLNKQEQDCLQTCFALAIDPDLGRVFAYMQDHSARAYITENLIAKLFSFNQNGWLHPASPLRNWNLIRIVAGNAGEPDRIECDPLIKNWLLGHNDLGEPLASIARYQPPQQPLTGWPVKKTVDHLRRIFNEDGHQRVRIIVSGAEGSGRKTFAAVVCQQLGIGLISVDGAEIADTRRQQIYLQLQRHAFLTNMAIAWNGLQSEEKFRWYNIPSFHIQFFIADAGEHLQPDGAFVDLRIELPGLKYEERVSLWKQCVPQSAGWPQDELNQLIVRYQSTIGQLVSLSQKRCSTIAEACEALKEDTANRLGKLAQLSNGNFTEDDLVVSDGIKAAIGDFTFEATERVHFWEQSAAQRLFPQGRSLIALFTGSPGTGKTMAAQVIAATLKLDLFRIDLSAVTSKYIGESSKNLERILSRAKAMDIVLLFDEADSLFGKRTEIKDAHDRYANTDTNYLLQAIEQYPGIIILSSNKKAGIDPAFMRRFRYVLDFPKPDVAQRIQLWRRLVQELAGEQAMRNLENEIDKLAGLMEMTGAQIKQSVLSAIFSARKEQQPLQISHVLKAIERELMKEGKSIGREFKQHFN